MYMLPQCTVFVSLRKFARTTLPMNTSANNAWVVEYSSAVLLSLNCNTNCNNLNVEMCTERQSRGTLHHHLGLLVFKTQAELPMISSVAAAPHAHQSI
jgi:hypothetical protein